MVPYFGTLNIVDGIMKQYWLTEKEGKRGAVHVLTLLVEVMIF